MPVVEDNRKRSIPEPVSKAMLIRNFPVFQHKIDYSNLVYSQLNIIERAAEERGDKVEADRARRAKKLLEFMIAWTHNEHAIGGIEEHKQLYIKESGAAREAISKTGIIKETGGD